MLTGTLATLAIFALFIGFVSRERLFWIADNDPVVADILENAHITNDLWFPLYRKRNQIDAQYRRLIRVYFWSSLAGTVLLLAAFAVHWLAA